MNKVYTEVCTVDASMVNYRLYSCIVLLLGCAEALEDWSDNEGWGHESKDWIDPILYSEFLMHDIILVVYLMKKIIFSLLPLDQNPEMMGPAVKFPWDLQGFIHQRRNVNHSWFYFALIMPFHSWEAEVERTNKISTKWSPSLRSSL